MRNLWLNKLAKRRRAPEISESQLCQLRYHQDHRGDFAEHKYVVDRNVLSLSSDGSLAMSDAATTAEECLDGQLDKQRAAAAIDAALAKMPSSHARAWSAFEREHLSYAEIAEREDVLVGTVMSRIYRARRAIESAFAAA
jgi:DNA-directed RNA polymerase specialized sigma24 family protein